MDQLGGLGGSIRLVGVVVIAALLAGCASDADRPDGPQFTVEQGPDRVTVNIDGELFTEYLAFCGRKPALWPVIGPTGTPMTRAYPMGEPTPGGTNDHPHHRSVWFGYEGFNGVDFWQEWEADVLSGLQRPVDPGRIVHSQFVTVRADGDTAKIVARNVYLNTATDKLVGKDERTLTFGADDEARWIDFQIKLIASEGPLVIGDTKEGAFAVRVPDTMRVDAGQGGRIVNSEGETDAAAWGRPAEWVDYNGPVEGEHLGIAILVHPSSYHPKPHWHVRTYGLFAVNPFGEDAYLPQNSDAGAKPWEDRKIVATIEPDQSLTLRYRVILHRGDEKEGKIAEAFAAYADE